MSSVRLSSRPRQPGTKGVPARYGKRLVCVRYRYDPEGGKRFETTEVIVGILESHSKAAQSSDDGTVAVWVGWQERELQRRVKAAGGSWNPAARVWRLRRGRVVEIGLEDRIAGGHIDVDGLVDHLHLYGTI